MVELRKLVVKNPEYENDPEYFVETAQTVSSSEKTGYIDQKSKANELISHINVLSNGSPSLTPVKNHSLTEKKKHSLKKRKLNDIFCKASDILDETLNISEPIDIVNPLVPVSCANKYADFEKARMFDDVS